MEIMGSMAAELHKALVDLSRNADA